MHHNRSNKVQVAKSNASMVEWNGRYQDDQRGGLPGSSAEREEGVVVDVGNQRGISSDLGVYRREEGEETVNT